MTLKEIELQLANLQRAVLQLASNGVAQTQTVDNTKSETATNTASIETINTDIEALEAQDAVLNASQIEQDELIAELMFGGDVNE